MLPAGRLATALAAAFAFGLAGAGALASTDPPATGSLYGLHKPGAAGEPISAVYDPAAGETHVWGRLADDLCFSLRMPREWRAAAAGGGPTRLEAVSSGAELEIVARSADDLRDAAGPDLPRRSAAALQREYEETLGKPAQSASIEPLGDAGAIRWAATWIDANFSGAGGAFAVETVIIPVAPEWLLELTATKVEGGAMADALVGRALSSLEVATGGGCRP